MKIKILKLNKGFTLVETLVAISIFTGSVLGLLALTGGSISNTNYARDRIVATFLAQEGLEYMRNLRDTYVLFQSNGWGDEGTDNDDGSGGEPPGSFIKELNDGGCMLESGCYFNPDNLDYGIPSDQAMKFIEIYPCDGGVCPNLLYDNESYTRKFNYTNGSPTSFSRKIIIRKVVNTDFNNKELEVISMVTFNSGNRNYTVSFSNYLKNWNEF